MIKEPMNKYWRTSVYRLLHYQLLLTWLSVIGCHGASFNEAYANSVLSNIEQLISLPWTRVNNLLFAAFNSRWSYVYDGDAFATAQGPDGYIQYVNHNHSLQYSWTIFKSFVDEDAYSVYGFYIGFENGKVFGYTGTPSIKYDQVRPGIARLMEDGNASCPDWNITIRCTRIYGGNSTDSTTGAIIGKPTLAMMYDPRVRPWYIQSMQEGSIWTEPYIFASQSVLGITAARQVITDEGHVIGVVGTDYLLSSMEDILVNQVEGREEFTLYIVDNKGLLIAASVTGAAIDQNLNQIRANTSNSLQISKTAQYIEQEVGGWTAANGTVITVDVVGEGLYWAQSNELRDEYGLHWHVVVVELVSCDVGFYSPPEYKKTECKECIDGGECPGGSSLPYPSAGYWVDRTKYKFGDEVYACSWETCLGFEAKAKILAEKRNKKTDDDYKTTLSSCWTESSFNSSECDSDDLQCEKGSTGPLCGSCISDYTYNSALRGCVKCESQSVIPVVVGGAVFGLVALILFIFVLRDGRMFGGNGIAVTRSRLISCYNSILTIPPFSVLKHVDQGMIKVVWATAQILGTISWNLSLRFPDPFHSLLKALAFLQLDFFALDCRFKRANFITRVLFSSFTPIGVCILVGIVYFCRRFAFVYNNKDQLQNKDWVAKKKKVLGVIYHQHLKFFLLIGFLVLPTVSMMQFLALECVHFKNGSSYVRMDTSISCDSQHYKAFVILDSFLILIYQSVPLLWFAFLYPLRKKLNPKGAAKLKDNVMEKVISLGRRISNNPNSVKKKTFAETTMSTDSIETAGFLTEAEANAVRGRNGDPSVHHLSFLWKDYMPNRWYYEVLEMYRRIIFIAVIPLLSQESTLRVTLGCMISILCVAFVREASPFVRASTNVLLNIAQYQILVTFFGAFIIMTDALDVLGLSDIALGLLLFCSNFFIVILVAFWSFKRYWIEKMKQRWRRALNAKELQILNKVMADQKFHDDDDQSPRKLGDHLKNSQSLSLEQYIIAPKHVVMKKKIGSGAFGEVFKGTCRGETVAIKTMINVTVETAKLFKEEIMLTAQLKHPNIVNFIGCCYGQELACLILEFVKRGTLGDMLKGEESHDLDWMDPLLKLATEIAQGMAYLHGTKQTEGNPTATVQDKEIILHRDLKPDNVLISEFVSAKITDFGTSRTKETRNDVTMSGVGTPLFCAPEISRGEIYDEKVDVYSFGLILLDMATEEDLIDFIGERWRQHFKKKSKPKQAMKFIRTMSEEGWRPITPTHLEKLRNKSKNQNSLENNQRRPSTQNGDFCNEDDVGFVAHVLPYAPLSIISLIIECTDHDPKKRPSFIDIVEEMKTKCYEEINTFQYYEQVEKNRSSFYLLHPELQHRDHSFHHSFHTQFQRDHQGEHQAEHRPEQQRDSQEGKHQVQSSFEFVIADMEQHRLEEEEKRVKEANETHNNWFLEAFL